MFSCSQLHQAGFKIIRLDLKTEAVAYIEEPKIYILLVLSAKTEEEFDRSFKAFKKLVNSYTFLDNVYFNDLRDKDKILNLAKAQADTLRGSDYSNQFEERFSQLHASDLRECMKGVLPNSNTFNLLFKINRDGLVTDIVMIPEVGATDCLIEQTKFDLYPVPPDEGGGIDRWVKIDLKITE